MTRKNAEISDEAKLGKWGSTFSETDEIYSAAYHNSRDAIMFLDSEKFLDCNRASLDLFDVEGRDAFLKLNPVHLSPEYQPDGKASAVAAEEGIQIALQHGHARFEWLHQTPQGRLFPAEVVLNCVPTSRGTILQAIVRDISEKKEAEKLSKTREEILRAVAFASERFLQTANLDQEIEGVLQKLGQATDTSRAYIFQNGRDDAGNLTMSMQYEWAREGVSAELENPNLQNLSYDDGFSRWKDILAENQVIVGNVSDFPEQEQQSLFEQDIWSIAIVPVFLDNYWWGFIGFDQCGKFRKWNNTEINLLRFAATTFGAALKQERRYRESESMTDEMGTRMARQTLALQTEIIERGRLTDAHHRLSTAVEQATEAFIITDPRGNIQYVNPAFCKITGYLREEIYGKHIETMRSGLHSAEFYQEMEEATQAGRLWKNRIKNRRKDGSIYEAESSIAPIRDANGKIINYVSVQRDVSHESMLESQLRQAQKMEAIGTLAGGIAHDFNNILSAIIGYSELVMLDLDEKSQTWENIQEVIKAGDRARELVNQILTFSREREQELRSMRLAPIIKEAVKLLRGGLPSTIRIDQNIDTDCPSVMADATQVHQIVMNLCTNAFHAMGHKGGTLSVRLEDCFLSSSQASAYLNLKAGHYVRLQISDTGHGMDEETLKRIFEPFFTTKERGEGTGLGLAMIHGIVMNMKGSINVQSEPGKGTSFTLFFPTLQNEEQGLEHKQEQANNQTSSGGERVCIVDDEEAIVGLIKAVLKRYGYEPIGFENPNLALEYFRAGNEPVDLIITDLTMPEMTGLDLACAVGEIHPDIPIMLCTGYSDELDKKVLESSNIACYMLKPLSPSELGKKIRQILDARLSENP
ncbi:MAG: PAS domain S-box protein [Candidatus Sumerlaeia bacterium]